MSVPEHMPESFEGQLVRLMEECGETVQAASKVLRFGDRSWEGRPTNFALLEVEMRDLEEAISIVRQRYQTLSLNERKHKAAR